MVWTSKAGQITLSSMSADYCGIFWKRSYCPLFMYMNDPHGFFRRIEQFLPVLTVSYFIAIHERAG